MSADFTPEYAALTTGVGIVDFHDRTQIELTGIDRAAFLHNFTTNDIRNLKPGQGCETFLLDVRGHTVGHVLVFCTPDSLVLDTVPGQAERLTNHLNRYLIRDKVEIFDRSEDWSELLIAGAGTEVLLQRFLESAPIGPLDHQPARLAGQPIWLRRVEFAGMDGFLIAGVAEVIDGVGIALSLDGATVCDAAAFEAVRIEVGFPWFGVDITEKNLPQEVDRNTKAISFTKGCYLGQETVARIDALGHVNKLLRSLRFSNEAVPLPGTQLQTGGAVVGEVTSAAFSPMLQAPLALGYVRRGHEAIGTRLESDFGDAEVIKAPRQAS
jgi:folate-binding protein YgfZ